MFRQPLLNCLTFQWHDHETRESAESPLYTTRYFRANPAVHTAAVANLRHRGVEREERVAGERLVDDHADDAHHGGAAVVALGVQLELLDLGVGVAHPREVARDVTRLPVGVLGEQAVVNDGDLAHNLRPAGLRKRLPRGIGEAGMSSNLSGGKLRYEM